MIYDKNIKRHLRIAPTQKILRILQRKHFTLYIKLSTQTILLNIECMFALFVIK